jgi:hypothetical protein
MGRVEKSAIWHMDNIVELSSMSRHGWERRAGAEGQQSGLCRWCCVLCGRIPLASIVLGWYFSGLPRNRFKCSNSGFRPQILYFVFRNIPFILPNKEIPAPILLIRLSVFGCLSPSQAEKGQ